MLVIEKKLLLHFISFNIIHIDKTKVFTILECTILLESYQNAEVDKVMIEHPIAPIYDEHSKILILGSFPSVKSREEGFFYGHPQNRFWKVLAAVYQAQIPKTIEEKKAFLLQNQVAVWDVIQSCDIVGSSDSSIKNVVPNDLHQILQKASIEKIFVNGKKAMQLYEKYIEPDIGKEAVCLPSTSPANAAWKLERLVEVWERQIKG